MINTTNTQKIIDKHFKGILFDMDGVLTDTMPDHCSAWKNTFSDLYGIDIPEKELLLREGEKSDKSIPELLSAFISHTPTEDEIFKVQQYKSEIFNKPGILKLYPLVEKILSTAKEKGLKLALVTGSRKDIVFEDFPLDLNYYFSAVITSSDVTSGKPHPEPYFKALQELDLSPLECLTIENAPLGIQSAKKAGTFVLAIETSLPAKYLKQADTIIKDHQQLLNIIEDICHGY